MSKRLCRSYTRLHAFTSCRKCREEAKASSTLEATSIENTMSQIASENEVFSFAYGASLLGVSVVSFVAIFKAFEACRRVRRRTIRKQDEVDAMKRAVDEKEEENRVLKKALDAARVDGKNKDDSLGIFRLEIQQTQKRLADTEQQLERTRDQNRYLGDQVKSQAKEIKMAKDETTHVKTQLAQTLKLLEDRTLELKGAQVSEFVVPLLLLQPLASKLKCIAVILDEDGCRYFWG